MKPSKTDPAGRLMAALDQRLASQQIGKVDPKRIYFTSFAAFILLREYFRRVTRLSFMPLLVLDGPSGIGKTTIFGEVKAYLEEMGHPVVYLNLDMFLKDPAWRYQQIEKMIRGKIDPETYDESHFFDMEGIQSMLRQISGFRRSRRETGTLLIPRAWDAEKRIFERRELPLTRDMAVIIEGKYAHLEELRPFYERQTFRVRFKSDHPDEVRYQFEQRGSGGFDEEKRLWFYDQVVVRSFERYARRTAFCLNGQLNLSPEEENY